MPPALRELRLAVRPSSGGYAAEASLRDVLLYPPHPGAPLGALPGTILGSRVEELARALVEAASLPPEACAIPPGTVTPAVGAAKWDPAAALAALERPRAAAGLVALQGALARVVEPLLAAAPGLDPDVFTRLVVECGDPIVDAIPWERVRLFLDPGGRTNDVVLRRHAGGAGEATRPPDLPLTVAWLQLEPSPPPPQWLEAMLVTPHTELARTLGAIEGGPLADGGVKPGEIHHLVFDASDRASVSRLASLLQRLAPRPSGRDTRPPEAVIPSLVILHDVSAGGLGRGLGPLASALVARGADAVLVVPTRGPDAAFFAELYRKVLHDEPLDVCAEAGARYARRDAWILAAREGGELRLRIAQMVHAAAARVAVRPKLARAAPHAADEPASAAAPPDDALESVAGARVAAAPAAPPPPSGAAAPDDGLESLAIAPAPAPGPPPPSPPRQRSGRVAEELRSAAFDAAEANRARVRAIADETSGAPFRAEGAELASAVRARLAARDSETLVETAEAAATALANGGRREVEKIVRLTTVWLTAPDDATPLGADAPVRVGVPHDVHVQITPRVKAAIAREAFPEEKVRELFEKLEKIPLEVVLFAVREDVEVSVLAGTIELPRYGESTTARFRMTARRAGALQLRACVYHGATLLQSVAVRLVAVAPGARAAPGEVSQRLDWAVSPDLSLLGELARPRVSVFMNDGPGGDHWVGLFAPADRASGKPSASELRRFEPAELARLAAPVRAGLGEALSLGGWGADATADDRKLRAAAIERLARVGYDLYDSLLADPGGADRAAHDRLVTELLHPAIVSVARCEAARPTFPWAAVYDYRLSGATPAALCTLFERKGPLGGDLLGSPAECRSQQGCPLADRDRRLATVCPFGFWGLRHQVELPLQHLEPAPDGALSPQLTGPRGGAMESLIRRGDGKVRLAFMAWPFAEVEKHLVELRALPVEISEARERGPALDLLEQGGRHVLYFFCHGKLDEHGKFFVVVGPDDEHGRIETGELDPREIHWPEDPDPLVFLNGCDTLAMLPETTNKFMTRMKTLGAAGAIGTEIEVSTSVAREVARLVLGRMLAGDSIGEAFLAMRRELFRSLSPLGLAYTFYAPAPLHFHAEGGCACCKRHGLPGA